MNNLSILNNEKGSTILMAVIFLMLVTVLGAFATNTAFIENQISGNDKINKMVFYAADSGIQYVAVRPELYGSDNTDEDQYLNFPDPDTPADTYAVSDQLAFNGKVTNKATTQMPEGSGYSAGIIFAINYEIESNSTGPNQGAEKVTAQFYRIGL